MLVYSQCHSHEDSFEGHEFVSANWPAVPELDYGIFKLYNLLLEDILDKLFSSQVDRDRDCLISNN